jgi:hypothetical protein
MKIQMVDFSTNNYKFTKIILRKIKGKAEKCFRAAFSKVGPMIPGGGAGSMKDFWGCLKLV